MAKKAKIIRDHLNHASRYRGQPWLLHYDPPEITFLLGQVLQGHFPVFFENLRSKKIIAYLNCL